MPCRGRRNLDSAETGVSFRITQTLGSLACPDPVPPQCWCSVPGRSIATQKPGRDLQGTIRVLTKEEIARLMNRRR